MLNAFKETLKPCTNLRTSQFVTQSQPSILHDFDSINPRNPPRSYLSQQLKRLDDFISVPQRKAQHKPKQPIRDVHHGKKEAEEEGYERKERELSGVDKLKTKSVQFEQIGPFEPLILSPDGHFPLTQVPASINCRLLEHQRVGVKFLYELYKNNHGGVLGDDMGLGKTIQTIAFLAAVFRKDIESGISTNHVTKMGPVIIICPTSVIRNWENEFSKWATFNVSVYHGPNRDLILNKLEANGVEILITSFDSFRLHGNVLSEIQWEIVVVDEAHRLKNEKSKLYTACLEIKTRKRFGLTGTIMQNKIMELFNLLDWVAPGSLGTREHFREFYDEPLKQGQRSSAPERFVRIADERKLHLVSVLQKYLLRRTKEETIGHLMLGKEDNVVFCSMSELQKRVYKRVLQLPDIQCLINKDLPCICGSPLPQVECCKRTIPDGLIWPYLHKDNPDGCDSCPFCIVLPCLVKLQQISNHLELIKPNPRDEPEKQKKDANFASVVFDDDINIMNENGLSDNFMSLSDVKHCGKMRALEKLMSSWISHGDKILLFSYSVRMLDILEKFLIRRGYCFARLDGSTPFNLRQSLVDDFNSSPSKQVFLISTRAGGLGLNLVSANRVVIFDPNWNPAQDLQAQDRSFRFGQKRHVVVFRLLAGGSLEELVYSRQVYKQQLSNIAVSGKMEKRYFEGVQDCKEFKGELFGICNLFRDLSDELFTSDIIESHGKQGQHGLTELAPHFSRSEKMMLEVPPGRMKNDSKLEELGILYAHRNEDVVNAGAGIHKKDEIKEDSDVEKDKKKKIQYKMIAEFNGMGEVEFSKWLVSMSYREREKVLRDYKRRLHADQTSRDFTEACARSRPLHRSLRQIASSTSPKPLARSCLDRVPFTEALPDRVPFIEALPDRPPTVQSQYQGD